MKKFSMLGLVLISTLILGACGSGTNNSNKTKKTSSTATATTETKAKEDKGTYKDRTLTVPDGVLKITEFQKGTSFDGKPIFYVLFDLTNNTKEAQDVQMLYSSFVSVSQNTGDTTEDLTYGIVNDSPIKDRIDMLNKKVNPGATVQAAYPYEFADETKPVTFTFRDSMFSMGDPIAVEEITIK